MSFYSSEEQEYHLYLAMLDCFNNNRELLVHNYYSKHLKEFPDYKEDYLRFLQALIDKRYIKCGCPYAGGTLIWGENIEDWRKKMEVFSQKDSPSIVSGPTFNGPVNAQNIHTGTGNIEINNSDAEKIVSIMKELVENSSTKSNKEGLIEKLLRIGKTAIGFIKSLVGLG